MPNIKSQIKRDLTNEAARQRNASFKSEVRTACKKVEALAAEGKKEEAKEALKEAVSKLDKIAQSGVIKQNNADRKKAHLEAVVAKIA
ncbi:MAG: 30S ribosomal protein S20 [Firmicutes bacterium]|uniref:Small ribosomal subunit protein bS20 n=1 Tax=Candidatus Alloenteromonas pullistercoris TaxID=2840785 RepID=A0A9D9GVK4_9FIRM|nr:30S ribosomal protein S20 [Candidatus Enteromonas pullistercoris]